MVPSLNDLILETEVDFGEDIYALSEIIRSLELLQGVPISNDAGWTVGESPRIGLIRDVPSYLTKALGPTVVQLDTYSSILPLIKSHLLAHPNDSTAHALAGHILFKTLHVSMALKHLIKALALGDFRILPELAMIADLCDQDELTHRIGALALEQTDKMAMANFEAIPASGRGEIRLETCRKFDPTDSKKNIISFSLWGDARKYVTGAVINAQIAPYLFPGWTARFYHDTSVPAGALDALRQYGAETVLIDDIALLDMGMFWRFLVADDPAVNVFQIRDTDCRLNGQEMNAVFDWLGSGKPFHTMRDHRFHLGPMMGGMWGGTAGVLPPIRNLLRSGAAYDGRYNQDQLFLWERIWPLIKKHTCSHDSFHEFHGSKPFPGDYRLNQSNGDHVGAGYSTNMDWRLLYRADGASCGVDRNER